MTRLDNDLISRKALLEEVNKGYKSYWQSYWHFGTYKDICNLITNAPTVEQDSEPVAYWDGKEDFISLDTYQEYKKLGFHINCTQPLYTSPPKREWRGLSDEEISLMAFNDDWGL